MFEDTVTSVFLSVIATDVGSIADLMKVVDDTIGVAVIVVSDGDPHVTLKLPLCPP